MAINYSEVFYDNLCTQSGVTLSYNQPETEGKEAVNCFDWLDYSYFQTSTGGSVLEVTIPDGGAFDTWIVYSAPYPGTGTETLSLHYESAPGTFDLVDQFSSHGGKMEIGEFTEINLVAGRRLKFTFGAVTTGQRIRQIFVGKAMVMETGQYEGISPTALLGGVVTETTISQNGSILGRNVRRIERSGEINLEHLSASWVRNTWDAFARHAARFAFFYRWAPIAYPTDVAMATGEIETPRNSSPPGKLAVRMPLRVIVSDEDNAI